MAGGQDRRGAPLPAVLREAAAARAAERARAFCWVEGAEGEPGPWPGVVVRWVREPAGWQALTAYVVTSARGERRVVVEAVPAGRLRAR